VFFKFIFNCLVIHKTPQIFIKRSKFFKEFGSFDKYLWSFVNYKTIKNKFKKHSDLPSYTTISKKLSLDLKKRGFNFVGPTICYALMQAVGMVNDHTIDCFRYSKL
jgi:DNA-3-methyladenine glycosylase I